MTVRATYRALRACVVYAQPWTFARAVRRFKKDDTFIGWQSKFPDWIDRLGGGYVQQSAVKLEAAAANERLCSRGCGRPATKGFRTCALCQDEARERARRARRRLKRRQKSSDYVAGYRAGMRAKNKGSG